MLDEALALVYTLFSGIFDLSLEKLQIFRKHQEPKWCKIKRKGFGKYTSLLRYNAETWMEHHNTEKCYSRKFSRFVPDGSLIFPTYFWMELVSRIITNFKKHLNMYRKSGKPARKISHLRMATFLYGHRGWGTQKYYNMATKPHL